jgi:hypothetical protein
MASLLLDDTLMTGTNAFAAAEENMHTQFDMGPRQMLSERTPVIFGGVLTHKSDGLVEICRQKYISNVTLLETSSPSITDSAKKEDSMHGCRHGPARILATESSS